MIEIYKTILEFPDYEISNLGNCRNKKRLNILKPILMKRGYYQYGLQKTNEDGKRIGTHEYQHRLIAKYFIENPCNKSDIDHIDGNTSNNNIDNLRWVTKSENLRNQKKANNKTSNYKGICYDKSRNKYTSYIEVNKIVKRFGRFDTELEAVNVRNDYIINNNLGEFFKLNVYIDI
jgi:hypothetical protein